MMSSITGELQTPMNCAEEGYDLDHNQYLFYSRYSVYPVSFLNSPIFLDGGEKGYDLQRRHIQFE